MEAKEFSLIRHYLGKTQIELSKLLCVSTKAIQSYEEGWRGIPVSAERQLLFLLSFKKPEKGKRDCWDIKSCPPERRNRCAAWEFKAGHLCWFINGTFCQGEFQDNWDEKAKICRQCEVFRSIIPSLMRDVAEEERSQ
jgi:hypothetical protein